MHTSLSKVQIYTLAIIIDGKEEGVRQKGGGGKVLKVNSQYNGLVGINNTVFVPHIPKR